MTESTRGILTDADRKFLQMDPEKRKEEYSDSAIIQRWNSISKRVYYGIMDLPGLYHNLPAAKREEAFKLIEQGVIQDKRSSILQFGAAFLFLGVAEQANIDLDDEDFYKDFFERVIEKVLMKHGAGTGIPDNVDVEVGIEGWDPVADGLAGVDPREHTEDTLRFLLFRGEITNEEFARGILDRPTDAD